MHQKKVRMPRIEHQKYDDRAWTVYDEPLLLRAAFRLEINGFHLCIENPPAQSGKTLDFEYTLEAHVLVAESIAPWRNTKEFAITVSDFLLAWEIEQTIKRHDDAKFHFVLDAVEVSPRETKATGGAIYLPSMVGEGKCYPLGSVLNAYPNPPSIVASEDVRWLWSRFCLYRNGFEPLGACGYFFFSWLTFAGGGADGAAKRFAINRDVLDRLSRLTTVVGDRMAVRKVSKQMTLKPLQISERNWLDALMRAIIVRAGEVAAGKTGFSLITFADLPKL